VLYIVPTPIGNLQDITIRSIKVLEKAKFVLCEDGKITSKLFRLLEISNNPTFVNLSKNNSFNTNGIEFCLESNLTSQDKVQNLESDDLVIALVSDAGTPTISDPGYEVVRMAQKMNIQYTVLPGSTALIPALVASGRSGAGFEFIGFLPLKKNRNTTWLNITHSLQNTPSKPIIIYESVHRIDKFIMECKKYLPESTGVWIGQELTKMNEFYWQGNVKDLDNLDLTTKGEFVIILG
jgi:16S rRNA (cytidine1402-2'-O)-methyltransferase